MASASLRGGTRSPVAVRPDVPGNYSKLNGTLFLGWDAAAANGSCTTTDIGAAARGTIARHTIAVKKPSAAAVAVTGYPASSSAKSRQGGSCA